MPPLLLDDFGLMLRELPDLVECEGHAAHALRMQTIGANAVQGAFEVMSGVLLG